MTGNMSNKFPSTLSTPMYRVDSVDSVDKVHDTPDEPLTRLKLP